jgi:hypothetical protein
MGRLLALPANIFVARKKHKHSSLFCQKENSFMTSRTEILIRLAHKY